MYKGKLIVGGSQARFACYWAADRDLKGSKENKPYVSTSFHDLLFYPAYIRSVIGCRLPCDPLVADPVGAE